MAEETSKPATTKTAAKSDDAKAGVAGLAPIQGEAAPDERPAEEQPGTKEHLGENPYQGGDSPYVEGDQDARSR